MQVQRSQVTITSFPVLRRLISVARSHETARRVVCTGIIFAPCNPRSVAKRPAAPAVLSSCTPPCTRAARTSENAHGYWHFWAWTDIRPMPAFMSTWP